MYLSETEHQLLGNANTGFISTDASYRTHQSVHLESLRMYPYNLNVMGQKGEEGRREKKSCARISILSPEPDPVKVEHVFHCVCFFVATANRNWIGILKSMCCKTSSYFLHCNGGVRFVRFLGSSGKISHPSSTSSHHIMASLETGTLEIPHGYRCPISLDMMWV